MNSLEEYVETRNHYLSNAEKMIQAGSYRKASEMLWGAISQSIKALAIVKSNRVLYSHSDTTNFISQVSKELNNHKIYETYAYVEKLHSNFYEDIIPEIHFQSYYKRTIELLKIIESIINAPINETSV